KLQLPFGNYSAKQLAPLAALINLEEFTCNLGGDTEDKLQVMAAMTKLRNLDLGGVRMTDTALSHVGKITGLESVYLLGTAEWRVTDATMVHLKNLTKLKNLTLTGAAVTGDGLAHLETFTSLETLDLGNTPVTDVGLKHLQKLTKLRTLNLAKTNI